jgi:predicted aspartyl protease
VPHFTLQFQNGGPQIEIYVGVSQPRSTALQQAGQQVPQFQLIRGLVDTGASTTAIDPSVVQGLGLSPTGSISVLTPSTGSIPIQASTFDVSIVIPIFSGQTFTLPAVQVFESSLSVQGIQALIGRDILKNALLVYDGRNSIFSLAL